MERNQIISISILLIWFCSCNFEQTPLSTVPFSNSQIQSRGTEESQYLPTGSQILVSANGGLQIDNGIFTYNGNHWESEDNFNWTNPQEETKITALYPVYNDKKYTNSNLYTHNLLEDVLIAQNSISGKEIVNLQFRHLFSLLTLHIEDALLENLKEVQLTAPVQVSDIHSNGTFTLTEKSFISSQAHNGTPDYKFIIPPQEESILILCLVMNDQTSYTTHLNSHTFLSGMKYECNIHSLEETPGIHTAEDLIIFSQIINQTYKGSRKWTDFGKEVDGKRVFYLLNDIALTEEDCKLLAPIGEDFNVPFTDTFDGKGHTISNLRFKAYNGYGGLFNIVETTGKIKDLHIDNSSGPIVEGGYKSGIGFIAGACYGEISNCHVTNSTLSTDENTDIGGIAGVLTGQIINSSVAYCKLTATSSESLLGGISGNVGSGKIINCCTYQNTISGKGNNRGGITGQLYNSTLTNCYVYKNSYDSYATGKGMMVGYGYKSTISYCYHDKTPLVKGESNCTTRESYVYTTQFTATDNKTPVYQLLNQWITNDIYTKWKESPTLPAIFDK